MPHTYDYPRPSVTVDVALFSPRAGALDILLIRRRSPPFAGRWALPGGFLDMDEELEAAARRELYEETAVTPGPLLQLGAWGTVGRDPRGRTISVVFLALEGETAGAARAGDDASGADWFSVDALPALAFDHDAILRAARRRLTALALAPGGLAALLDPGAPAADAVRLAEAVLEPAGRGRSGRRTRATGTASRSRRSRPRQGSRKRPPPKGGR